MDRDRFVPPGDPLAIRATMAQQILVDETREFWALTRQRSEAAYNRAERRHQKHGPRLAKVTRIA